MMSTHAWNSQWDCERPATAPEPARPIRCSEPMFAAKIDAPIASQPTLRPPRKKSVAFSCFRFVNHTTHASSRK